MYVKCDKEFKASLDDGVTTTTFAANQIHYVPDWVGKVAIKHYGAKRILSLRLVAELEKERKEKLVAELQAIKAQRADQDRKGRILESLPFVPTGVITFFRPQNTNT